MHLRQHLRWGYRFPVLPWKAVLEDCSTTRETNPKGKVILHIISQKRSTHFASQALNHSFFLGCGVIWSIASAKQSLEILAILVLFVDWFGDSMK